ncbi:hypothetical protein [Sulfurimonas sp.]|uniref:hypothetical protein n=1 Tax=Sulfurimonas sp. TaxID=2022749 RepID=UPI002A35DF34|nr:hypothetical protein [Sulfurimonas sp.]MDY0124110.1 hypothetical protein [Sulfurimonas sp.]
MELDWKVLIAVLALAISIYTLLDNRRSRSIEKKTIVINELMEARLLLAQLNDVINDIEQIRDVEKLSNNQTITDCKSECKNMAQKLDYCFDKIMNHEKISANSLEKLRPLINNVISRTKYTYGFATNLKHEISNTVSIHE